jgi:hypothetical protein
MFSLNYILRDESHFDQIHSLLGLVAEKTKENYSGSPGND